MPQIIVTAHDDETTVMLRERINPSDFESERFAANLVERLGWAVLDATEAEREERAEARDERVDERPKRTRPITGEHLRHGEHEPHIAPVGSA